MLLIPSQGGILPQFSNLNRYSFVQPTGVSSGLFRESPVNARLGVFQRVVLESDCMQKN